MYYIRNYEKHYIIRCIVLQFYYCFLPHMYFIFMHDFNLKPNILFHNIASKGSASLNKLTNLFSFNHLFIIITKFKYQTICTFRFKLLHFNIQLVVLISE